MAACHHCSGHGRGSPALAQWHRPCRTSCFGTVRRTGESGGGPVNMATDTPQIIPQVVEYIRILPELVLATFGMLIMVLDPLVDERHSQRTLGVIALLGSLAAIGATLY